MTLTEPTRSTKRWEHLRDAKVAQIKRELRSNGIRSMRSRKAREARERGAAGQGAV